MKKQIFKAVSLMVILSFFVASGCASSRGRVLKSTIHLYNKSYVEVWEAVNDLLLKDLNCFAEVTDKKAGKIETGWVHTMDMDGYNRWKIMARVKKKKKGVSVELDKTEQVKKTPKQRVGMYAEERRKHEERNTADASTWRTLAVDKAEIESMYNNLNIKLNK